jgi:hypothetical protein
VWRPTRPVAPATAIFMTASCYISLDGFVRAMTDRSGER